MGKASMARRKSGDISGNPPAGEERARSRKVGALGGLRPFLRPYRGMVVVAALALTLTATVSLLLPVAVRRVIDGFSAGHAGLLDQYFGAALGIAALLAVGTGFRYYFVTRLGERVVADIRRAMFDRVMGLSPAFFERLMTGEVLSRLTTDTTLILSVIGSSVSVALRNMLMLVGAMVMLFLTSAKLAGLVLLIVPVVMVPLAPSPMLKPVEVVPGVSSAIAAPAAAGIPVSSEPARSRLRRRGGRPPRRAWSAGRRGRSGLRDGSGPGRPERGRRPRSWRT